MHDPKVEEFKQKIIDLKEEVRQHGASVDDAKCAALCETSAEVLQGLETAFTHYIESSEPAWQEEPNEDIASM